MSPAVPLLFVAIAVEVGATAALPRARGFSDPLWTAIVLGGYGISIWLLALIVKHMDIGAVYAIWSGLGTAAIAVVGVIWLGERLDALKVVALAMIVVGVVVLNLRGGHGGHRSTESAAATAPTGSTVDVSTR